MAKIELCQHLKRRIYETEAERIFFIKNTGSWW